MKYTLKEMCANALRQDLATHDFQFLWKHYYLMTYAVKELLDNQGNTLNVSDYAALNALLRDWEALTINDQYGMFEECKDGDWHTTVLKLARHYVSANSGKYIEHTKSLYLDSFRQLSSNMVREVHGDNTLIALQFESSVKSIPANCFSGNPNLSTVIIPSTTYFIGSKAFADCPNLSTVYIDGEPTIENGAFPASAKILHTGVSAPAPTNNKELESKVTDLEAQVKEAKADKEILAKESSELKAKIEDIKASMGKMSVELNDAVHERDALKAELEQAKEKLAQPVEIPTPAPAPTVDKVVAELITSMLPNGSKMIEKAETDKQFAETVLMSTYEKCLTLKYKFGVTELQRGEMIDAKIANLTKHSENDYAKAMSTLKAMSDEGLLSSRHLDAIRSLTGEVDKKSTYKEKILTILEEHGLTESDYQSKYDECLSTINKTELKYTPTKDYDKLVADNIENYLSHGGSLEDAIRKHKGLAPGTDVSSEVESLKMMREVMSSSLSGMSEEDALLSLVPRLP